MKTFRKITSILLAVCMFSACNTTSTEVPTVTTTTAKTTAATVTTTAPLETSKTKEFVAASTTKTKDESTTVPSFDKELVTTELPAHETSTSTNLPPTEFSAIDLVTFPKESKFTEIDSIAIILMSLNLELSTGRGIAKVFSNNCDIMDFSDNIDVNSTGVKNWGFCPQVVIKAFTKFSYKKFMVDLTGCNSDKLYSYIDSELPVMVWVTEDLAKPEIAFSSENVKLYGPKDTVILVGYSDTHVKVWSTLENDYIIYDRNLFEQRFEEMGSMALVVDQNS